MIGRSSMSYDYLVVATGAQHSYFGRDDWAAYAPGLKTLEDATEIRRRLLTAFERAEGADDPAERAAWMTFVIVGGGPTGVELAGAIAELARHGLDKEFRAIDPAAATVVLVQSAARLLPTFPPALSIDAAMTLEQLGVTVRLDAKVSKVDENGVLLAGEALPARTVLWLRAYKPHRPPRGSAHSRTRPVARQWGRISPSMRAGWSSRSGTSPLAAPGTGSWFRDWRQPQSRAAFMSRVSSAGVSRAGRPRNRSGTVTQAVSRPSVGRRPSRTSTVSRFAGRSLGGCGAQPISCS